MSDLALFGGRPVHNGSWPDWPRFDAAEEQALLRVLRCGNWWGLEGEEVDRFEAEHRALFFGRALTRMWVGTHTGQVHLDGFEHRAGVVKRQRLGIIQDVHDVPVGLQVSAETVLEFGPISHPNHLRP